ncbi:hypothetical protein LWC33_15850 [Pseudonocardia sp. RS11V-5]|uniref:hypothetical protein n=1 Tax=Pseudonocardia terrae TaxID=2905831 RepID=UPI001E4F5AAD|nr:hypothetical protein [Pseudonocardia terrae]MCE3552923.1 hypothetical protein [Pseudonocardia terrae]
MDQRVENDLRQPSLVERVAQNPVGGFLPWIIFWVVANSPSTWEYGAIGAALAAIILAVPSTRKHRTKLLDVVTIVFFVGLAVAGAVVGAHDRDVLDTYSTTISSGVLGLVALISLAFTPFTEQYARESTPEEVWSTPEFTHVNRVLTLVWGIAFLVTALLGYIAARLPSTSDWTDWILPIVVLVGAFKFTRWYPEHRSRR